LFVILIVIFQVCLLPLPASPTSREGVIYYISGLLFSMLKFFCQKDKSLLPPVPELFVEGGGMRWRKWAFTAVKTVKDIPFNKKNTPSPGA
jgi:hypothetical protein